MPSPCLASHYGTAAHCHGHRLKHPPALAHRCASVLSTIYRYSTPLNESDAASADVLDMLVRLDMATSVGFSLDHDQYTTVRHLSHNFGQPPLHLQDQQIGCVLSVPCIPRPPRGLDDSARTCNECSKAFSFVSARVCASCNLTITAPALHTLS